MKSYKEYMISIIRSHQYYKAGTIERMTEKQVKDIFEELLDWIEQ